MTMKLALAHDHLFQMGGAEQVLKEMGNLFPDAPIYSLIHKASNFPSFAHQQIHTSFLQHAPGGISFFKWYLQTMPLAWEQFDFSSYDMVISSSSAFVKGIILRPGAVHISYCHSPTRYLWSDRREYVDAIRLPIPLKWYLSAMLSRLRSWDQLAAQRVDHFIANSQHVASRIKRYYNRSSTVIYPPVDTSQFYARESDDFYLLVSRLRPYKRVDVAIEAFNHLRIPLVIIGGGEEYAHLKQKAKHNITFLGEVSDHVRNEYLSRCKAFIHPQEEDFGISAVEAMASGKPVIAYNAGGAKETIVHGTTGILYDDPSWESLIYAVLSMSAYTFDPRVCIEHAKRFDVSVFRRTMMDFIASHAHATTDDRH
jgi:glycosyltransferase involved in cell wall biosynthesis